MSCGSWPTTTSTPRGTGSECGGWPGTLFRTGVLQRWAMISYFAVCAPGQEEATFERLKKFIAASAPEFQLVPRPNGQTPPPGAAAS